MLHVRRHGHHLCIAPLHEPPVYEGPVLEVDVGQEAPIPIPRIHVELESDGFTRDQLAVRLLGLVPVHLDALRRVLRLWRVHPDVADLLWEAR